MSLRGGSGRVVALVTIGVAAVAALVAVLVVQPWSGGGNAGPGPVPDRAGAPDCGVFVQEVASGGISAAGWHCFTTAMSDGAHGRLRETKFTTEGDPVFVTYTTNGDGSATVTTDARLDAYGGTGTRVQTEICRRPESRPVARGMFLDCAAPAAVSPQGSVAQVMCEFAMSRHLLSAQLTTLASVRAANVGGPYPGVRPGKDLFPARPGAMPAAWCWTDQSRTTWTLYVALPTGESARFVSTAAGTTPPSGPPSFP